MKTAKIKYKFLAGFLAFALALILGAGFPAIPAYAANGNIYTCTITPCYRHPVTGEIEDSGGESSYATGQGMVEGAVYTTGIMEVTEDGNYYLTIRMSLMDYTSGHSFWVQNVGDSGWSTPAVGITANGTDSNGTTADVCIQVPSENCVVRGSMYVEPMGRDVIFYLYPSNYSEGNNTNMISTMITTDTESSSADSATSTQSSNNSSLITSNSSSQGSSSDTESDTQNNSTSEVSTETDTNKTSSDTTENNSEDTKSTNTLQSSITEPATENTTVSTEDTSLDRAGGLSLSTEGESNDEDNADSVVSAVSIGQQIFVLVISITIAGLILLAVGAVIVYYFRKNWYRWGGGEDDE